uniref:Uncharacterized protein n=1 Tax=Meloidogyne incognita TaxID=6306 RepID=A0A914KK16_MELIC
MYCYSEIIKSKEPYIINFAIRLTCVNFAEAELILLKQNIQIRSLADLARARLLLKNNNPHLFKDLLLKLPYIPKNIKEMCLWRFWLDRLLMNCIFVDDIKFDNIIFNPTMLMLLLENKNPINPYSIRVRFEADLVNIILQQNHAFWGESKNAYIEFIPGSKPMFPYLKFAKLSSMMKEIGNDWLNYTDFVFAYIENLLVKI